MTQARRNQPQHARGLLGRLAGRQTGRRSERDAILAHLQALLNTRAGESVSAPEFGVVDFADVVHNFPASMQVLVHSIRATLLRYEPRLRAVTIQPVGGDDPLTLAFEISARFSEEGREALRLRTELSPSGRFNVSG